MKTLQPMLRGLFLLCALCVAWAIGAVADPVRVAAFSTELSRNGPGLLLRDILKGEDDQVAAVVAVIAEVAPDILFLADIDYDHGLAALSALADRLDDAGQPYPYRFALRPNSGIATGLDMDLNGRTGEPRDAQGYGRFAGQGGIGLLSKLPLDIDAASDFTDLLWVDLPGASLPVLDGAPFFPEPVRAIQRLSSTAHWMIPVLLPDGGRLTVMGFAATPPVFDGPEDRNGLRNADEIGLWLACLDGKLDGCAPEGSFVLLGKANLDPLDGDGLHDRMTLLLDDPRLQDPAPRSTGGEAMPSRGHLGDPGLDTADWSEPEEGGPGNLRVDYVLPSADLRVVAAGVHWPSEGPALDLVEAASRHRLVWVDLDLDR